MAQRVKHLPAMWETRVWSLCWEDPLKKETATHSSILAWRIPWTEQPGRLQSMGLQRVGHDWATSLNFSPNYYLVIVPEFYYYFKNSSSKWNQGTLSYSRKSSSTFKGSEGTWMHLKRWLAQLQLTLFWSVEGHFKNYISINIIKYIFILIVRSEWEVKLCLSCDLTPSCAPP